MRRTPEDTARKRAEYREAVGRELTTIMIEPRRPGRPSAYTPELGRLVCEKMVEYGSVTEACRQCEELPDRVTVYNWALSHPEFDQSFSRAWELLGLRWSDDLVTIADQEELDPNDRRVRIDTRKWVLSKLAARRFGDKLQVAGDPDNPIRILHDKVSLNDLSGPELDALEQFASARMRAIDVVADEDQE